jgi:hypothetical protein
MKRHRVEGETHAQMRRRVADVSRLERMRCRFAPDLFARARGTHRWSRGHHKTGPMWAITWQGAPARRFIPFDAPDDRAIFPDDYT